MKYYTEGVIKKVSIVDKKFSVVPRKEYLHEERDKVFLLAVEPDIYNQDSAQSMLLSAKTFFHFKKCGTQLSILSTSKVLVGVEFELNDVKELKSPIEVTDIIIL